MRFPVKNKRIVAYAVIIILIMIFGLIFPVYHLYDPLFGQKHSVPITVKAGYSNVTYAGDYEANNSSSNPFLFSSTVSRSIVTDAGYPNSSLDLRLTNGFIYWIGSPNNVVSVNYNLTINGNFTSNLQPNSLTISFGANGPNQSSVILFTWAPPYSSWIPTAENLSPYTLGYLNLVGPGNVSVTTNLLNENGNVPYYDFYVSVQMELTMHWYNGSSHLFDLSAQVNGLSEPVNSTLAMTILEMS